jgi:hypothetical protein
MGEFSCEEVWTAKSGGSRTAVFTGRTALISFENGRIKRPLVLTIHRIMRQPEDLDGIPHFDLPKRI